MAVADLVEMMRLVRAISIELALKPLASAILYQSHRLQRPAAWDLAAALAPSLPRATGLMKS